MAYPLGYLAAQAVVGEMKRGKRRRIDRGTNETRRKLKPDYLLSMAKRGQIHPSMLQAAGSIRVAFEYITSAVGLRISDPARPPGLGSQELAVARFEVYERHYTEWREAMKERRLNHYMLLEIVVGDLTCKDIDRVCGRRRGYGKEFLVEGLGLYCELRGWPT